MKIRIFLIVLTACIYANAFSQDWGNWIRVGNGIEISFKFGKTSCAFANTYARLRNTSASSYCSVTVSFTTFCDNETQTLSILASKLSPGAILESRGNFYSTSLQVNDITLTKLTDVNCKTIVSRSVSTQPQNNTGNAGGNNSAIPIINYKNGGYGIPQDGDVINNPKPQAPVNNSNGNNTFPQLTPKKGTYGISQQGDVINNPKPPVNYAQKQQQEDAATSNAMEAWKNSYQAGQDQINKINNLQSDIKLQQQKQQQSAQQEIAKKQQQAQERLKLAQQQSAAQQQLYQQTQVELDNAKNVTMNTYQESVNSGKKESGAMLDAMLAGAQQISDPKASLAYTGVGLGLAGLTALSERKEAKIAARQDELSKLKASLPGSQSILNFASGVTSYHITNLKVVKKSNGRIKSVIRTNLYDILVNINSIRNTEDSITILESVNFKNIVSSADSMVINKIVFAIADLKVAAAYNGNYTNGFDYSTDSYANYRYRELDNSSIEHAFTMQGDFPQLPSGLTDVYIKTKYDGVRVSTKYVTNGSHFLSDDDFKDAYVHMTDTYLLVFDDWNDRVVDFVDYLNALK